MGGKGSGGHNRKPVERKQRIGNPSGRKLPKETPTASVTALPTSHIPEPSRPLGEQGLRLHIPNNPRTRIHTHQIPITTLVTTCSDLCEFHHLPAIANLITAQIACSALNLVRYFRRSPVCSSQTIQHLSSSKRAIENRDRSLVSRIN